MNNTVTIVINVAVGGRSIDDEYSGNFNATSNQFKKMQEKLSKIIFHPKFEFKY